MHVGLFINALRDTDLSVAHKLIGLIEKQGVSYDVSIVGGELSGAVSLEVLSQKSTLIIALGGDGTVLTAQQAASKAGIPVLGVNLGHIGFLTEIEPSLLQEALKRLINMDFSIESRAMLDIDVGGKSFCALNDVVLSKGTNTRPINIEVDLDGKMLDKYCADGLVFCTPTGSTAYSLSAGGPILGPDIQAFIINPICAHSLHSRPIVIADTHEVEFFTIAQDLAAQLVVDGKYVLDVVENQTVKVKKSAYSAKFIKLSNLSFYDKLLQKLNYWGVTALEKE